MLFKCPLKNAKRRLILRQGGGGGEQLPIHSFKRNPNGVLTTCKAIIEAIASGFVKCY